MPKPPLKKRLILLFSSVILGIVVAFGWREIKTPLAGGSKPDNTFARWAKNRAYSIIPPAEDRAATRLTPENANGWFSIFAEPVQSFSLYQSQNPTRPTPTRRTLVLQPLGEMNAEEKAILADCKLYCETFFGLTTRIAPPLLVEENRFSPRPAKVGTSKTQLHSGALLEKLLRPNLPADAAAYLGLTSDDLYTEGLSFVFGQATFHKRVGVYSLARYFPKKRDPKRAAFERKTALRRTVQILTHEAGHMFGITHCVLYRCAMNGSNSLSDSDASPLNYCPVCARKLAWNIGFDRAERAAKLESLQVRWDLK